MKYNSNLNLYKDEIKAYPPYVDDKLYIPSVIKHNTLRNIQIFKKTTIIIASLSSPHHFRRRCSFRKLYFKYSRMKNCKLLFFIGSSKYERSDILNVESLTYDDVVQFSFQNSYLNLTLLSIMAIKYCYENFKSIKFYIKTDDDMLINYNLLKIIIENTSSSENVIYGHLGGGGKTNRNKNNRNYIPFSQYKYEYIPKYVYGGLIIISSITLKDIYSLTLYSQSYIWREDINLGAMCRICKCNIKQFPNKIDISINNSNCSLSDNIIASEYKSNYDAYYCIK